MKAIQGLDGPQWHGREREDKLVKYLSVLLLAAQAAIAQIGGASIQGTVLDAKTQKAIPAAWVIAIRAGVPPFTRNTKSGGDGAFQIQGLGPGSYSLCVQAESDQFLNPCQWNGNPATVTLTATQTVSGILLRLTPASLLTVQVQDPQKALSQQTKDGRRPDLSVGVWGPQGMYYPAHPADSSPSPIAAGGLPGGIRNYTYQLAVPRDTALKVQIASHDLKLGDGAGLALPANTSQQAFQHATGDPNPKSFAFTVLGVLP
jgi:hypothetical protein